MSELKLNIGDDAVRGLVAEGILASLTSEKREELLKASLEHLLSPKVVERRKPGGDHWEKEKISVFQSIWEEESRRLLGEVIREDLLRPDNPLRVKIRDTLVRAAEQFMLDEKRSKKLCDVLANALAGMVDEAL